MAELVEVEVLTNPNKPLKVAVVGVGNAGLPIVACLLKQGHQVKAIDIEAEKISQLTNANRDVLSPALMTKLMPPWQRGGDG